LPANRHRSGDKPTLYFDFDASPGKNNAPKKSACCGAAVVVEEAEVFGPDGKCLSLTTHGHKTKKDCRFRRTKKCLLCRKKIGTPVYYWVYRPVN
jgi:hypothetical protein